MNNRPSLPVPSNGERLGGWIYLPFYLFLLPVMLAAILIAMGHTGLSAEDQIRMNLIYGALNFLILGFIFRKYLNESAAQAFSRPGRFLGAIFGGLVIYFFGTSTMASLSEYLIPGMENVNDAQIVELLDSGRVEMLIFTIALAPLAEELIFRGLIFSTIYPRSRFWAYAVSICLFSLLHVLGFIGSYPIATLGVCFLEYLPASFGLAWALEFSGSIWADIGVHMLANTFAMLANLTA